MPPELETALALLTIELARDIELRDDWIRSATDAHSTALVAHEAAFIAACFLRVYARRSHVEPETMLQEIIAGTLGRHDRLEPGA